jgi:nitroreductase
MSEALSSAVPFPTWGTLEDKAAFLLRYAILAPSSHNSQPWSFSLERDGVAIVPDLRRWLPEADPDQRELYLSLGCALENLLIAAEHFGFGHEVVYPAEADRRGPAARVTLLAEGTPSTCRPDELFLAITGRATSRGRYRRWPVAEDALRELRECAMDDGVGLLLTGEAGVRARLRDLAARADRLRAGHDAGVVEGAPLLGLVYSAGDDRQSQVRAGQAFERLALLATNRGLGIQPLTQLIALPHLRQELRALLPQAEAWAQILFRLGHARPAARRTSRRPVDAVLARP